MRARLAPAPRDPSRPSRGWGAAIARLLFLATTAAPLALPGAARADEPFDDPGLDPERMSYLSTVDDLVERAMEDEDWALAVARADEGLRLAPHHPLLAMARDRASRERRAQAEYERFLVEKERDPERALRTFLEIPADSVYRARGDAEYERLRERFVGPRLQAARKLLRARCADVTTRAKSVLAIAPDDDEARWLVEVCQQQPALARAAAPSGAVRPSAPAHVQRPGQRLRDLKDPFEEPSPAHHRGPDDGPSRDRPLGPDLRDPFGLVD